MMPSLTIPITTQHGEYRIELTAMDPIIAVNKEDVVWFKDCTIYDILLECNRRDVPVDMEAINGIGSELQKILEVNPNIILYFFCDFNGKTIRIRKREQLIPPQEYRSRLFSTLFDRIMRKGNRYNFINRRHIVPIGEDGDAYIHLIFPEHLTKQADLLKETIAAQIK